MAPKLYATIASPSVRAVLLTIRALGINAELEEVDLTNKDQLKPKFMKINPQHTLPTLDDDGFILWDSHAINAYLVDTYAGIDDTLYPTDSQQRARVNQRLHFDTELATLNNRILSSIMNGQKKSAPQTEVDELLAKLELLDKLLASSPWATGAKPTIADHSLIATVTTIELLVPLDAKKFPKITAWLKKAQALPYYAANKNGLDRLKTLLAQRLAS